MAHNSTLIQADDDFYIVAEDGGNTLLTPPSTVAITAERPPRFDVSGVHAVVVNSVDQPLIVDDNGIMLFLSPPAPTAAPVLSSSAGAGGLTGTYGVKYTFAIRDLSGTIIAESGFSPSATVTLTAKKLHAASIQLLSGLTPANYDDRYDIVRRFYRTTNGTSTYFFWYTLADNTTDNFEDDASDASINTLSAEALGTAPFLSNVASFRERLFGVDDSTNREVLLYSESGLRWAWPTDNIFTMSQVKGDSQSGITALMPRRDALGIAKSNMLVQLTGSSDVDFREVVLSTSVGCVSQESACIYRDAWYFLGQNGVYRWDEQGIKCISDGKVRSWFTTDTSFKRDDFVNAFACIDQNRKVYKLFLIPADADKTAVSTDTWVEFDIESETWWGPHNTVAFDFTSAFSLASHSTLIGEGALDGYIIVDSDTRSDVTFVGESFAPINDGIVIEAITCPIKASDPPTTAYYGMLIPEVIPQGIATLSIYPTVGEPDDDEGTVLEHDMTDATAQLGRLGYGRYLILRFYHHSSNSLLQLLGFEVSPVNIVGRRQ